MTGKRARGTFSYEQKKQLVELFKHGKPRSEIIREYDLAASACDKWAKRINATGSSREKDNRTIEEQELIKLRKKKSATANGKWRYKTSSVDIRTKAIVTKTILNISAVQMSRHCTEHLLLRMP